VVERTSNRAVVDQAAAECCPLVRARSAHGEQFAAETGKKDQVLADPSGERPTGRHVGDSDTD
jgi:hypothetical protein